MFEWNEYEYTEEEKEEFEAERAEIKKRREERRLREEKTNALRKKVTGVVAFAALFFAVAGGAFAGTRAVAGKNTTDTAAIAKEAVSADHIDGQEDAGTSTSAEADAARNIREAGVYEDRTAGQEAGVEEPLTGSAAVTAEGDGSIAVSTTVEEDMTVADVAEEAMPAMVSITNTSVETARGFFFGKDQTYESVSAGSGIIIGEKDGQLMIATNAHVVEGARSITVTFIDETEAEGTLVGSDTEKDLAVVAVKADSLSEKTRNAIKTVEIGSSTAIRVGEQVVAIGNALGYGQSVSAGYLSAKDRIIENMGGSDENSIGLLQTDAAINPGNSGGALLDMEGKLIGINSAKFADTQVEGMGFAIPIDTARPILESMMSDQTGSVADAGEDDANVVIGEDGAYLGIECYSISEEAATYYATPQGVLVQNVLPGTPAEQAGLQQADIITAIDDFAIEGQESLSEVLSYYEPGDAAVITFARTDEYGGYKTFTTEVVFTSRSNA